MGGLLGAVARAVGQIKCAAIYVGLCACFAALFILRRMAIKASPFYG